MGDANGAETKQTLVVVSWDHLWSSLTSLLQETLGGEGTGVALSSAGPYRVCDVTVDQRSLRLLSVALQKTMNQEDISRALDGCFRSNTHGPVLFLLLLQGGHNSKEEEELVKILQRRFGAEVFKFLLVLSVARDTVVVVDVLDDSLMELIQLCDGRFCQLTGAPATRGELLALGKMVEQTLEENGAYSREMLGEAGRRNTEDRAMGLLTEKLLGAVQRQEAFQEKVRQREEERGKELEELKRSHAEERRSEEEEKGRYQEKKDSLEEALRSHASMVHLEMNRATDEAMKTSIIMVGLSGSGKTSTMTTILKRADRHHSLRDPGPPEPQPTFRCLRKEVLHQGQNLLLVDTPELLDEDGAENLDVVKDCLALALPGPHVFLLVFQMGRFTQGEAELLLHLPRIFGPQVLERAIVVFTRDDDKTSIHQYVAGAPSALQEIVRRCGSRYHVLNVGDARAALSYPQVRDLLSEVRRLVAAQAGAPLASRRFSAEELRKRREKLSTEEGF